MNLKEIVFCIVFVLNYKPSESSLLPLASTPDANRQSITQCMLNLSIEYFAPGETIVFALPGQQSGQNIFPLEKELLESLFIRADWTIFSQKHSIPLRKVAVNKKRNNNYIIYIRNQDNVLQNILFLKKHSWNAHAKFVVIITVQFENAEVVAFEIARVLWSHHILLGLILIPRFNAEGIIDFYTWNPYSKGNCGAEIYEVDIIDSCTNGVFERFIDLFPNKVPAKFNGCVLKIRTVLWPPFIISPPNLDRSQISIPFTEGLEVEMINVITQSMNMTPRFSISMKVQDWGNMLENGTGSGGLFKQITDEKTDIGMASLAATQNRYMALDFTASYATESVTWCVPVALEEDKWLSLLRILHLGSWIATLIAFICIDLIIWSISKLFPDQESTIFQNLGTCSLYNFCAVLSITIKTLPNNGYIRVIFFLWVIYGFNLCVSFQTFLMTKLTQPDYKKQISTAKEIFDTDYKIAYLTGTDIYFADNSTIEAQRVLHDGILCTQAEACIKKVANNGDTAFVVPRSYLEFISTSFYNKKGRLMIYWFTDNIVSYPIQIFAYRGHPLIARLNELILRVKTGGFMQKWMVDTILNFKKKGKKLMEEDSGESKKEQVLTFDHLQGPFLILLFGLVTATISFIVEVSYFNIKRMRGPKKLKHKQKKFELSFKN